MSAARRLRINRGLAVLLTVWAAATSTAQELVGPFEPARLPVSDADLEKLQLEIEAEITALQAESEPKTESAATQPSEPELARSAASRELLESLKTYQVLIKENRELRAQVHGLGQTERLAEMEAELATLRARIDRVRDELANRPPMVTREELVDAEKELEEALSQLAARSASRDERVRRIASAAADWDAAGAEVQRAQAVLFEIAAQHESKLSAAGNDSDRAREVYRLRAAQVALGVAQLRAERLELESQRDTLLGPHADERVRLLQELVELLQRRADLFKEVRARNLLESARDWVDYGRAHPDRLSPYAQAHWDVCLEMVSGIDQILGLLARSGARDRFSEEAAAGLSADLGEERELWTRFMESLDRRPGSQIKDRFLQIESRIEFWSSKRRDLAGMSEATYDDRTRIESRLDDIDEAVRRKLAAARKAVSDPAFAAEDAKLRQDLAGYQQTFEKEVQVIRDGLDKLSARLDSALKAVGDHVTMLSSTRSRLYWTYLTVRDQPVWKYRPRKSLEEWRSDEEVLQRRRDLGALREGIESVTPVQRGVIGGVCIAALCLATVMRLKLFRHADAWELGVGERMKQAGFSVAPLSDRIHFWGVRFLARTALLVWPSLVAWCCVSLTTLSERFFGTLLLFLSLAGVSSALIRTLFPRSRIRFRILPCSNAVALYYRRWLFVIFWTLFLMIPAPLLLAVFNWAPYTGSHLAAAAKIAVILELLVFLANKQTVLKVAGRPEGLRYRLLHLMLSTAYPLIYLGLLGLLVTQAVGYSALTTYVIRGAAASVGVMLATALLLKYIGDRARTYRRRALEEIARQEREIEAARASAEEATAADELDGQEAPQVSGAVLWVGGVASLLRWGILLSGAGTVLRIWGIRWVEIRSWMDLEILAPGEGGRPAITVGRALLALLIFVLSWMASRTIRSVMETQVFPAYSQLDRGGRAAVKTLVHYFLMLLGCYFALATLRIPLGALTVVLGTIGLGIGLGLQPLVLNFFSGLVMLFERHLKVGDLIEVDGQVGEVTEIRMRATSVRTPDGVDIVIPNGDFISNRVVNLTLGDTRLRGKLTVGVAYGTNPRLVERLLLALASQDPLVLADPPPRVRFMNFGDNSLEFALFVWFKNAEDRFDFLTDTRYRIVELFREHGIEIPFPQRTLNVPGGTLRVQVESPASSRVEHADPVPPAPARGGDAAPAEPSAARAGASQRGAAAQPR